MRLHACPAHFAAIAKKDARFLTSGMVAGIIGYFPGNVAAHKQKEPVTMIAEDLPSRLDEPERNREAFIRLQTAVTRLEFVPELHLHLATEVTPLWQATEATLAQANLPPPYWAFAWVGGQALARYILDHPHLVAGRTVLDFAAGSGVAGIAAARAGAAAVLAVDIDPLACTAVRLNALLNSVTVSVSAADPLPRPWPDIQVILAGDVCYERPMAAAVTAWLHHLAAAGALVLLGDPGRAYLPADGLHPLAHYTIPTLSDVEDRTARETKVWRM